MEAIIQHIKERLQQNHKVTLNGMGYLYKKYIPADINPFSEVITPPSSKIIFEADNFANDSDLSLSLSATQGIESYEAQNRLDIFLRDIKNTIEVDKKVYFDSIGSFYKEGNQYAFEVDKNSTLDKEYFGLQPISFTRTNHALEVTAISSVPNPISSTQTGFMPNPEDEALLKKIPVTATQEYPIQEEEQLSTARRIGWLVGLIACTIIGVIIWWWAHISEYKMDKMTASVKNIFSSDLPVQDTIAKTTNTTTKPAITTTNTTTNSADTTKPPTTTTEPTEEQTPTKSEVKSEVKNGEYGVIVSSFKKKEQAEKRVKELIKDKYKAYIVENPKSEKYKYRVAVGKGYASKADAQAYLKEIQSKVDKEALVYKINH